MVTEVNVDSIAEAVQAIDKLKVELLFGEAGEEAKGLGLHAEAHFMAAMANLDTARAMMALAELNANAIRAARQMDR